MAKLSNYRISFNCTHNLSGILKYFPLVCPKVNYFNVLKGISLLDGLKYMKSPSHTFSNFLKPTTISRVIEVLSGHPRLVYGDILK